MTWDKKGLNELSKIKSDIESEMSNKTIWFKLNAAERRARHDMLKVVNEILGGD